MSKSVRLPQTESAGQLMISNVPPGQSRSVPLPMNSNAELLLTQNTSRSVPSPQTRFVPRCQSSNVQLSMSSSVPLSTINNVPLFLNSLVPPPTSLFVTMFQQISSTTSTSDAPDLAGTKRSKRRMPRKKRARPRAEKRDNLTSLQTVVEPSETLDSMQMLEEDLELEEDPLEVLESMLMLEVVLVSTDAQSAVLFQPEELSPAVLSLGSEPQ